MSHFFSKAAFLTCAFLLLSRDAYAYIDLGVAGQVFQLAYLILFSALLLVVSPIMFFWAKVSKWIKAHWKLSVFALVLPITILLFLLIMME